MVFEALDKRKASHPETPDYVVRRAIEGVKAWAEENGVQLLISFDARKKP